MHWEIGGYRPGDIEVVAAFDTDKRKVGVDVHAAIFSLLTARRFSVPISLSPASRCSMGQILDGFSDHMKNYDEKRTFVLANEPATQRSRYH